MVSPRSQRSSDHVEDSNSTANLFLGGGMRRTWMMGSKPTSGPRELHPTMRPVANPPASDASDRPADVPQPVPTLMSPVTPGANLHSASSNPSEHSSSVSVHKPDVPAPALPSPVPSAASRQSPVTAHVSTNGMNDTAPAAPPLPTDTPATRPEARASPQAQASSRQEPSQVSALSPHIPPAAGQALPQASRTQGVSHGYGEGGSPVTTTTRSSPSTGQIAPSQANNASAHSTARPGQPTARLGSQERNICAPQPLRLDTNGAAQARSPAPNRPSEETWSLWNKRLVALRKGVESCPSAITEPRFQLLQDACTHRDVLYLVLHQLYCRLYLDQNVSFEFPSLREDSSARGFEQVRNLLEDNYHLPYQAVVWFSQFPGRPEEVTKQAWYADTVQELARFLRLLTQRFVTDQSPIFKEVSARRYPPLVEELRMEFGVDTPVFMSVIFASLCRRLYNPVHLSLLNQIFRRDLSTDHRLRATVRPQLIEEYQRIPMRTPARTDGHPTAPPPPRPPTTASPVSHSQTVSGASQPVTTSHVSLPPSQHAPPPTASPNVRLAHPGHSSQLATNSPQVPPLSSPSTGSMLSVSPGTAYVPYQYPSQQILPSQNKNPNEPRMHLSEGQLWQVNRQGQLVPFDPAQLRQGESLPQWSPQSAYPTPTSAVWQDHVPHSQTLLRTIRSPQVQMPQVSQAQLPSASPHVDSPLMSAHRPSRPRRISQQMPQMSSSPQVDSPSVSADRPPWPSQVLHQTPQLQMSHTSSHPSSPSVPVHRSPWPSQVVQNGNQPPRPPAVLASQRRISLEAVPPQQVSSSVTRHQTGNLQSGLPLLPPSGYRIPYTVQPNAMRLGLHQADLRDPVKRLLQRDAQGRMLDTELFQYLLGFVLSPKFIDPETLIYNWNFSLSEEEFARCPRMISTGPGPPPVREYQKGCRTFRLRCIAVPGAGNKSAEDLWPTSNTVWPSVFYVFVNDVELQVRRKCHNGKDLPLDITDYLHKGENKISIQLLLDPKECKDFSYVFGIESMAIASFENLVCYVGNVSAADARAKIQQRLNPSAADDDDLTVVTDSLTVSLVDPFMAQIFREPARSIHCDHLECFDLATFINTRKSVSGPGPMNDNWRCPICNADARPQCLVIDQFLAEVRAELIAKDQLDGAQAIEIKTNGQWTLKSIPDDAHPDTENQRPTSSSSTAMKRKADNVPDSASAGSRLKVERSSSGTPGISQDPIVIELE